MRHRKRDIQGLSATVERGTKDRGGVKRESEGGRRKKLGECTSLQGKSLQSRLLRPTDGL